MILIIDNYDSFTYNLYQMIGAVDPNITIIKNDEMTCQQVDALEPTHLIISPGPGRPDKAGICEEAVLYFKGKIPILGICLGHQAICEVFGARITYAKSLVHGKTSNIHIANGSPIFKGLAPIITAARYHSLIVEKGSLPDDLLVIAEDDDGQVMGVKHRNYEIYGLQFHPESILTKNGNLIIENFLKISNGGGK
ncbi:MAG: aminodeoxychorismate/anthranilate synthase component II [Elusimicrobiota bacterium]|jgi:anthranilate synthase component 2|nr:aminodeoxychorismate/anthranilate synthase component II [Elusimicrobiota bacterium]